MIGTVINAASRVEELTKTEEFYNLPGPNIILTEGCFDSLKPSVRSTLELKPVPPRQLRGLGETKFRLFKLISLDQRSAPVLRERIDTSTLAIVDAIAQKIQ